ncbi:hypothetical protein PAECIP111893_04269 [Paenibacillus plantiphilus]|uniref:Uncharacterized protein n=1 Tax=Paenibacillus plantiphilus TaxID=2905650 RepID=A0ABN8GSY7_9BACL|nr:hypothetical protein [Paenibacillus plantiphilus]CAH1217389.1 hypothetical protein PAECIP111893_04269 [Paenibacillus plantiphilus]
MKNMIGKSVKLAIGMSLVASLLVAGVSSANSANGEKPKKQEWTKLEAEGKFSALQIGNRVYVFDNENQIFTTKGAGQLGPLQSLFVLGKGTPHEIPFVVVKNSKKGLMVFSDLWPKFDDGTYAADTTTAYDAGRIFYEAKTNIVSKTAHHTAVQKNGEVILNTANDFDDLKKGYHESFRAKGTLRGLIVYDCCGYLVVENSAGVLEVYHAGETGAEKIGEITLP